LAIAAHFIYNILGYSEFNRVLDLALNTTDPDSKLFHFPWGLVFIFIYFLSTISIFSNILNNALNNSIFFSYKKVINPNKILQKLLIYYGVIMGLQLLFYIYLNYSVFFNTYVSETKNAEFDFFMTTIRVFIYTLILLIVCIRLSRFKLIKNRWRKLKLELPIYFGSDELIKIKGDSYDESIISTYYQEYFALIPLYFQSSFLKRKRKAFIEKKILLNDNESVFLIKIFKIRGKNEFEYFLLKSKKQGVNVLKKSYPIVQVFKIDSIEKIEENDFSLEKLKKLDIGYVRPIKKEKK